MKHIVLVALMVLVFTQTSFASALLGVGNGHRFLRLGLLQGEDSRPFRRNARETRPVGDRSGLPFGHCFAPVYVRHDPHLSLLAEEFPVIEDPNQGLSLTLMMTDTDTAEIKHLRMIGLGHKFSVALLDRARALREEPFSLDAYQASLRNTMARYTTKQLVDLSTECFKLKG